MINDKSFLAIIPARGGSKRLPRKNVLGLQGKPLIAWTIEASINSKYIDRTIVSTDTNEISTISKQFKADVIIRPTELSTDTASSYDAILHTIDSISEKYDYIVLLQPTSPLRTSQHIDEAIVKLIQKKADAIVSICEMEHSPLWSNTLPDNGSMKHFLKKEIKNKRSQDLPLYYHLNGAIYICDLEQLKKEKSFIIEENIYSYIMNGFSSVDIDNRIDLELAKVLIRGLNDN